MDSDVMEREWEGLTLASALEAAERAAPRWGAEVTGRAWWEGPDEVVVEMWDHTGVWDLRVREGDTRH